MFSRVQIVSFIQSGHPRSLNPSFYRCDALNRAVKGSATSQHVQGKAIDISTGTKAGNKLIYDWAKENLIFDQLINEYDYSWVHISYNKNNNRNQTLIIT